MTRLQRVGQDARTCPGRRCPPRRGPAGRRRRASQPAGHLGQRAHVDHRGAQLGQLPLGQVGWRAEQRVGDDQAEHRVAEELQPLVGGQAAVLVGVRAVGQGALKQLGHRRGTPRACQQLGVGSARRAAAGCSGPRAHDAARAPSARQDGVEHLPAVVGAAGRAGRVRQLGLAALRAAHQRGRGGLPLRRAATGCCCATSSAWERPRQLSCSVGGAGPPVLIVKLAAARPTAGRAPVVPVPGPASASRTPHSAHSPGSPPGTAATAAARAPPRHAGRGSRSSRSPSRDVPVLVRRPPVLLG